MELKLVYESSKLQLTVGVDHYDNLSPCGLMTELMFSFRIGLFDAVQNYNTGKIWCQRKIGILNIYGQPVCWAHFPYEIYSRIQITFVYSVNL